VRLQRRHGRRLGVGTTLALGLLLGACAGHVGDMPVVGLPANTPARPAVAPDYLPVNDTPPPREQGVLSVEERAQLTRDLTAARERQHGTRATPSKARPSKSPSD